MQLWVFGLHAFQLDGYLLTSGNVCTWRDIHKNTTTAANCTSTKPMMYDYEWKLWGMRPGKVSNAWCCMKRETVWTLMWKSFQHRGYRGCCVKDVQTKCVFTLTKVNVTKRTTPYLSPQPVLVPHSQLHGCELSLPHTEIQMVMTHDTMPAQLFCTHFSSLKNKYSWMSYCKMKQNNSGRFTWHFWMVDEGKVASGIIQLLTWSVSKRHIEPRACVSIA